jgi:CubicO group peptidase (beta-lactamase class C family)
METPKAPETDPKADAAPASVAKPVTVVALATIWDGTTLTQRGQRCDVPEGEVAQLVARGLASLPDA